MKHPINPSHAKYYKELEIAREIGDTNMWGAAPYLLPDLGAEESVEVLLEWISNYDELLKLGYFTREEVKD